MISDEHFEPDGIYALIREVHGEAPEFIVPFTSSQPQYYPMSALVSSGDLRKASLDVVRTGRRFTRAARAMAFLVGSLGAAYGLGKAAISFYKS